jgi:hypothetical protein
MMEVPWCMRKAAMGKNDGDPVTGKLERGFRHPMDVRVELLTRMQESNCFPSRAGCCVTTVTSLPGSLPI